MKSDSFPDLATAYRQGIADLLSRGHSVPSVREPTSPASGFGVADRPSIELLGYTFEVANPLASLVDSDARPLRLAYCVGSLLWTLIGSDDLEHLQSYHPDARNFSDDGISLSGAFGKRLFRNQGRIDQIGAIVDRLRADPASRRTVAAISDAGDNVRQSREYPCCIGVQYFLREGALHSITYMRAQHALLVLPYDAFLFMALHCLVAARLGAKLGTYRHTCGTFHIYEAERALAETVLNAPLRSLEFGLPEGSQDELSSAVEFEARARAHGKERDTFSLERMLSDADSGSDFARMAKLVVAAHWLRQADRGDHNPALTRLPESMQLLIKRQWRASQIRTKGG